MEEKLFNIWARRDAHFEVWIEDDVLRVLSDYGIGASKLTRAKGKTFGAGYELYIVAFFIGLYSGQTLKLKGEIKKFGQTIQYWGHLDSKPGRKSYSKIIDFIFVALIAKTNIDLLALEKGDIEASFVVNQLIDTMDQYANYGFYQIYEKLKQNSSYFSRTSSFLDWIQELTTTPEKTVKQNDSGDEDSDPL